MSKKTKQETKEQNNNEKVTKENDNLTKEKQTKLDLEEQIKNLQDSLLRSQAEVINYKRRKDEEVSRLMKYANEDIILGFLPILDNFERAMNMDDDNLDDEVSKFLEGIKMVYTQTINLLNSFEVKEIECLDKVFDPTYHQAVVTACDEDKEDDIILEVLLKGYTYKDKVIRPAMVRVNKK